MPLINTGIIKNPLNWATVFLMLLFAAFFGHLALSYLGVEPTTNNS